MQLLLDIPLVGEYVFLPLLKLMYVHVLGFSKNTTASEIRASHDRLKTLDFELVQNNIKRLRQNSVPTVVAYSTNDPLVEVSLIANTYHYIPSYTPYPNLNNVFR